MLRYSRVAEGTHVGAEAVVRGPSRRGPSHPSTRDRAELVHLGMEEGALRDEVSRVMTRILRHDDDRKIWKM